jgi:hypothetical protein
MSEQVNKSENSTPAREAQPAASAATPPPMRTVSDPREVAALVLARIHQVNARKDELSAAIPALVDITQQLARSYVEHLVTIEHLHRRVKALEAAASGTAATGTVQ